MTETLKFLHVFAAVVWLGGGITQTLLMRRALKADPVHRLGLAHDMSFVGSRVFGPASVAAALFGIWMVLKEPAFAFGDTWIIIGLAGFILSGAIGGAFFSPKGKLLVSQLEAGSDAATGTLRIIGRVAVVDQLILLVVLWAMIAKPGA